MKSNRSCGFTLIEVMITVAIIGILAAIAMPSYNQYVIRSTRAAAQTELLQMASLQEKIYLNSNAYSSLITAGYNAQAGGGLNRITSLTTDGRYTLVLVMPPGINPQIYTLRATPFPGRSQVGNGCLQIQENGQRLWFQNSDNCTLNPIAW